MGIPAGTKLTPYVRLSGQDNFTPGNATITVQANGSFQWSRLVRKSKSVTAYVAWKDAESNRVFWARVR